MGKRKQRIFKSPQINIRCYANQSGNVCIPRKSFLVWRQNWPSGDDEIMMTVRSSEVGVINVGCSVERQWMPSLPHPPSHSGMFYLVSPILHLHPTTPASWFLVYHFWCLVSAPPYQLGLKPVWLSGIFYLVADIMSLVIVYAPLYQLKLGCLVASVLYLSGMPSKRYI